MSLLDAHIPQLVASESAFGAKAALMRSTIAQAEQHCSRLGDCVGFTFSCANPGGNCTAVSTADVYPIYFKSMTFCKTIYS